MPEADPWEDAQETELSDGVLLQFVGLSSPTHTLFVRILISPSSPAPKKHNYSVLQVLEWMQVMLRRQQATTQEGIVSQQLLELGAVWKLSLNCSSGGTGKMKRMRQCWDNANDPLIVGTESLRVHFRPSRFPNVKLVDWTLPTQVEKSSSTALAVPSKHKGIIHHDNDLGFAIVHKLSGLPSHATVDNGVENVLYQMEHQKQTLGQGASCKFSLPQRLDIETEGLLLVSTKPEFSSYMGRMLQQKSLISQAGDVKDEKHRPVVAIHKQYRCLVRLTDPQQREELMERGGLIEHYMDPKSLAPKTFQAEAQEGWLKCLLRILEVGPIMKYKEEKAEMGTRVMQVQLELLTGRTHQIRGQFAAMNMPLVGDPLYGSPGTRTGCMQAWDTRRHRGADTPNACTAHDEELLGLQCFTLRFPKPKWQIHEKKKRPFLVEDCREVCFFHLDNARWSNCLTEL